MTYTFYTGSPAETIALGRAVGRRLHGGDCIAYLGDLGAGKTTMTRGIAVGMGLDDDVTSPTFALVNEYRGRGLSLCHFDMYRITSDADLETTGFFDYMDEDTVLAVEWSENISGSLPDTAVYIRLERTGDETRKITIDGDDRFADIGDRDLG
ncbi:MAG: tRNA (adenosine(37)-N6)-threonylcarbamoyltransferase complex ATPase subunit type 1 TsaE [Ruminococcus sp.]|nr:tRNA (adenosine(37)-N6)-threonylcarbamoyltransferase complex ATPase subunit type 1 TsaE [Ruminococcus sp.]